MLTSLEYRLGLWIERYNVRISIATWIGALIALFMIVAIAGRAEAQAAPTVTLSASPTSGISPLDVTLTWSSTGATSCTASGGWTGTKATSGTQTVTGLRASATFTLTCSQGSGSADVTWTAPTKNTDGSNLTDLAGYKLRAASSAAGLASATAQTVGPTVSAYTFTGLAAGTWYFDIRATNAQGIDSVPAGPVSTAIVLQGASANASVTVNTQPNPPSGVTAVQRLVYDLKGGRLNKLVGRIELGTPCGGFVVKQAGYRWYEVSRSDVILTRPPRSSRIVAACAAT